MTVKIPVTYKSKDGEHFLLPIFQNYVYHRTGEGRKNFKEWMSIDHKIPYSEWHLAKYGARLETRRYPHVLLFDSERDAMLFILRFS